MMTRREWIRQGAMLGGGLALSTAVPGWTQEDSGTARRQAVAGKGSLKAHATAKGLLTGAAVHAGLFRQDEEFRKLLAEQYSILVAENCMKWNILRPTAETYSFDDADALVSFAEANGTKVRGHNFVWHEALPKWFEETATKENAGKFLVDHIRTVGGRYKGKIHSWDVVNEALLPKDGRPDGLRSSSAWFQLLGPGYIDLAFRTAREVDPHALLTYNEYGIEYDTEEENKKRELTFALLRRMKADGVPIDALGVQSHIHGEGSRDFSKSWQELADGAKALGLLVFITEMDVNDDKLDTTDTAQRDQQVAEVYRNYLTAALAHPEVKAVLTWGATDRNTWLNNTNKAHKMHPDRLERCLPFDENYAPVPAFFAMRESFDRASKR